VLILLRDEVKVPGAEGQYSFPESVPQHDVVLVPRMMGDTYSWGCLPETVAPAAQEASIWMSLV